MGDTLLRLTSALADRYRVDRELGAGGMATVFLAHDLKHERDVAIKVLHPDLGAALGAERFLSEIKTTAKLQHPHILPLLDSGAADGLLYYVMPYVSGETLRARLERERQLPIDDALRIAREVASALEHAHKQGIIHRDIKPENILLQDGAAVVADFGIALAVQSAGGARMTQTGLSLGTPQYMSPEQATGERTIDARSDIYALGAVTYEMLAGEPPFSGPSVQVIVARLLADAPRLITAQRKAVPAHVEAAVLRALEKLPADRFAQASAFAAALDSTSMVGGTHAVSHAPAATRTRGLFVGVAIGAALATVAGVIGLSQRESGAGVIRDRVAVDVSIGLSNRVHLAIAISPDGRKIAVIAADSLGTPSIRIRDLSIDSIRTVAGTEGASTVDFSRDGESLLFVTRTGELRSVATSGGATTLVAERVHNLKTHWGADRWIYYTNNTGTNGGLSRVRVNGGTPESLTVVDTLRHEFAHWEPQLLPGGKAVLFFSYTYPSDSSRVEVLDLVSRKRIPLLSHASNPRYINGGFVTFMRDGTVMAVRFNVEKLRVEGSPVPVLEDVAWEPTDGNLAYDVSDDGTISYLRQSDVDVPQLVREVGRDGRDGELLTTSGRWAEPRLSPDGRALALTRNGRRWQIWLLDRARHVLSQLTRSAGVSFSPNWTPDGRAIVHATETPVYDVVRTPLDGAAVVTLMRSRFDKVPSSVGPDGRTFAFTRVTGSTEVFVRTGNDSVRAVGTNAEDRGTPAISPDGRWIAYREHALGNRTEVYVQSLASFARRQVSSDGGDQPLWTKKGRELVYRRGDAVMAAPFDPSTGEPGRPVELFRRPAAGQLSGDRTTGYDVSPDGLRFFIIEQQQRDRRATAALIFNWRGDLERALRR